ncbi:hypothetical protein EJ06DRAFT_401465 [Trichodelitschia bisporula]|uniref:Uncharacterized protein n=1 Tax=Trichodelitschia bisporula TaxID=703511 RepID=A0A6G1HXB4_9PEZI|nr:hypothetical protein EJ06DRAFT_401465 [Trichodelitschia bisporula]
MAMYNAGCSHPPTQDSHRCEMRFTASLPGSLAGWRWASRPRSLRTDGLTVYEIPSLMALSKGLKCHAPRVSSSRASSMSYDGSSDGSTTPTGPEPTDGRYTYRPITARDPDVPGILRVPGEIMNLILSQLADHNRLVLALSSQTLYIRISPTPALRLFTWCGMKIYETIWGAFGRTPRTTRWCFLCQMHRPLLAPLLPGAPLLLPFFVNEEAGAMVEIPGGVVCARHARQRMFHPYYMHANKLASREWYRIRGWWCMHCSSIWTKDGPFTCASDHFGRWCRCKCKCPVQEVVLFTRCSGVKGGGLVWERDIFPKIPIFSATDGPPVVVTMR